MEQMEEHKKEIGKFMVGIRLLKEAENKLVSETHTINSNMSKEIIITELRTLVRMLEDNHYPNFINNLKKVDLGSEE